MLAPGPSLDRAAATYDQALQLALLLALLALLGSERELPDILHRADGAVQALHELAGATTAAVAPRRTALRRRWP